MSRCSKIGFMLEQAQAVVTTGTAPEGDLKLPVKWVLSRTRKEGNTELGRYH